jgi:hypothetical protein
MEFFTLVFGNLLSLGVGFGIYALYKKYTEYMYLKQLYEVAKFATVYAGLVGTFFTVDKVKQVFGSYQRNLEWIQERINNVSYPMQLEMENINKILKEIKENKPVSNENIAKKNDIDEMLVKNSTD